MEDFKKLSSNKNYDELQNFMKNSKIDLLKSIAKRFKLSISGKNKPQIISILMDAVKSNKVFQDKEPSLAQMSVAQLKTKAIALHIDISGLKMKQELRMAILNKLGPQAPSSSPTSQGATLGSTMKNYDVLKNKPLPYLKALAKQLKIKISKLSKEQLITSILEKTSNLDTIPTLNDNEISNDLSKQSKNILLTKAEELGLSLIEADGKKKKISKKELIDFIESKTKSPVTVTVPTTTSSKKPKKITNTSEIIFPISENDLGSLKLTIVQIKDLLKKYKVKIPSGTTKKEDLVLLLLKITTPSTTTTNTAATAPAPSLISNPVVTPPSIDAEIDIVSLEDINSPFVPANIDDLTEAPDDEKLREDVMRCLQFYEYPS